MKPLQFIAIVILSGLLSVSCRKGSMWGIRGEGSNVVETRYAKDFNAINLSIDADISYAQDSLYKLEVIGQRNILVVLETKVEGNNLTVDFKRNVWDHNKIKLVIHSPNLNKVYINGSGNVDITSPITGASLELKIGGSGNISVPSVSVQNMSAKISGTGDIRINGGTCINEYLNVSGNGNITSDFLVAKHGDAKITGSGDISIHSTESLSVKISGNGNVKYKGAPTIYSDIDGNGKLIHID